MILKSDLDQVNKYSNLHHSYPLKKVCLSAFDRLV